MLLLLLLAAPSRATEPAAGDVAPTLRLEGEWYLLVHYRDSSGENSEVVQWRDRIWRFEAEAVDPGDRAGDAEAGESGDPRLRWTLVDGVRFRDGRGRYTALEGGRLARSLGAWEPNAEQLVEIRAGLEVDHHGARSKTLRRSPGGVYRTSGSRSARSSSTIGYLEQWQIEGLPGAPVFVRDQSMGAGRTDELAGRTRFITREVSPRGDELTGDFDQDGVLVGRFRMLRMGDRGGDD